MGATPAEVSVGIQILWFLISQKIKSVVIYPQVIPPGYRVFSPCTTIID